MNSSNRHLRAGWWSLLGWLVLGIVLEGLHAFKAGWYLDVGHETRRLMFTLAHAHGVLLALINIVAGLTTRVVPGFTLARSASLALQWSAQMLPLGFLLGGLTIHGGDPGAGILLVPPAALLLVYGVGRMAKDAAKITIAAPAALVNAAPPLPAAPPREKGRDIAGARRRR